MDSKKNSLKVYVAPLWARPLTKVLFHSFVTNYFVIDLFLFFSTIRAALCNIGNLNVTLWNVFLSCRVLCTIKRILWMSMWLLFECALLETKVLFHSFITNYFVIELFFSHDQGSIIKSWKLVSYCFQVFKSRMFKAFRFFVLKS